MLTRTLKLMVFALIVRGCAEAGSQTFEFYERVEHGLISCTAVRHVRVFTKRFVGG